MTVQSRGVGAEMWVDLWGWESVWEEGGKGREFACVSRLPPLPASDPSSTTAKPPSPRSRICDGPREQHAESYTHKIFLLDRNVNVCLKIRPSQIVGMIQFNINSSLEHMMESIIQQIAVYCM